MGLYAIGDIHGCAKTLDVLLNRIAPTQDDHVLFIGDYIDRGPDSKGVIDRLIHLQETCQCTFLRGNHEAMMLDHIERNDSDLWRINGGISTLESYIRTGAPDIDESHKQFVRDTKLYHDEAGFFFVHAGLKPYLSIQDNLQQHGEEVFLWERSHLDAHYLEWEKPIVCGHTPQRQAINRPELICIDTGCVYNTYPGYGYLTAIRLPKRELIQVYNCE